MTTAVKDEIGNGKAVRSTSNDVSMATTSKLYLDLERNADSAQVISSRAVALITAHFICVGLDAAFFVT